MDRKFIARGGYGNVYKVEENGSVCAIKDTNLENRAKLLIETIKCNVLKSLMHANIMSH
jgi:hypothetical protein